MHQFSPVLLPVGHIQQRHASDCLATCVDMILKYYNAPVDYRRLLKVLKTDPNLGTPFPNVVNLQSLQINVIYRRGDLMQLYTFVSKGWPVLVPVRTSELPHWREDTKHAVVVVGMDKRDIYINDPAFANAPIQVPHGDFDLAWLEHDEYYAVLAT
jgi:ABC-type bacteriocin/lantibiotic exporter with double-glycine peptidase domain